MYTAPVVEMVELPAGLPPRGCSNETISFAHALLRASTRIV